MSDNNPPSEHTRRARRSSRDTLPRLAWSTIETAKALGVNPEALRRQCERAAKEADDGTITAQLDLGIVAHKRQARGGRWRFVIPASLTVAR